MRCAHCGSVEVSAGFDTYSCRTCGESTTAQGRQVPTLKRELNDDEYQASQTREFDALKLAHAALQQEHQALKEQHG